MGIFFLIVTIYFGWCNPEAAEVVIQQDPRPGTSLPIDKDQVRPRQILEGVDAFRVSTEEEQSLNTIHKSDELHGGASAILANIGQVIFTRLRIQQMRPCQMSFTATQCDETTQAADIGRGQAAVSNRQILGDKIQGEVMRANRENGAFQLIWRAIEADVNLIASLTALHARGMTAIPSARTNEVITPEPRANGAASNLSPTYPRAMRI